MDRDGVLRLLDERQGACRAQLDRLREEAGRIAGLLAACEVELERVATAREVVAGLAAVAGPHQEGVVASVEAGDEVGAFTGRALAVLAERRTAVRCRELAEALGGEIGARDVERVRHRMKRLARAGRVSEPAPGMFALPGTGSPTSG